MKPVKIVVEKHPEGYVAYPLGLNGVVVGQGGTYEDALADVQSAIRFHIETFGEREFLKFNHRWIVSNMFKQESLPSIS